MVRVILRTLLIVSAAAIGAAILASIASAQTSCPTEDVSCAAIVERLDAILAATNGDVTVQNWPTGFEAFVTNWPEESTGAQAVEGTVALSTEDREILLWIVAAVAFSVGAGLSFLLFDKLHHSIWGKLRG